MALIRMCVMLNSTLVNLVCLCNLLKTQLCCLCPNGRYNPLLYAHLFPQLTPPPTTYDITVAMEIVAQNPAVR